MIAVFQHAVERVRPVADQLPHTSRRCAAARDAQLKFLLLLDRGSDLLIRKSQDVLHQKIPARLSHLPAQCIVVEGAECDVPRLDMSVESPLVVNDMPPLPVHENIGKDKVKIADCMGILVVVDPVHILLDQ